MPILIDDSSSKQCAGIYPALACWWPMAPKPPSASAQLRPMHKPPLASAGITGQGRTTPAEQPPEGARLPQAVPPTAPGWW